jgi:hypothetical protein
MFGLIMVAVGCCVAVIISPPAPELKIDPLLLPQLAVDRGQHPLPARACRSAAPAWNASQQPPPLSRCQVPPERNLPGQKMAGPAGVKPQGVD